MKLAVVNIENKEVGQIELSDVVFGADVRKDVIHSMVNYQLDKRRSGCHKTKGISEVSGTGKKPWAQKGTGRARAGTIRRTQDRGGQTVFGPVVRSHATDLPKKMRVLALKSALSAKAAEGKLIILDEAKVASHKTQPMAAAMKGMGLNSALIIAGNEVDANFARAAANLPRIDVLPSQGVNVYDIIRRDTLVLTKDAVEALTERLAS